MVAISRSNNIPNIVRSVAPWLICGLGALFYCYEYLLRILPSVMMADLIREFSLSAAVFGQLGAFYYYAYTPMQLPVGLLFDRFGPRRLLTFACLSCVMGTVLFVVTHSFWGIMLGRFLVGFGSAFAFVGVLKLATIWLPPDRFAFVSGVTTALGMLGAMLGNLALSYLVVSHGWLWVTELSIVVGLVLAVAIFLMVRDFKEAMSETHHNDALVNTGFKELFKGVGSLLKRPQLWIVGIIGSLLFTSLSVFSELWGIPFLVHTQGFSSTEAAVVVSFVFFGWAIGAPFVGWLSDRIKLRVLPLRIAPLIAALLITLILLYADLFSYEMLCVLLFSYGFFCSSEVIVFALGREISPSHLSATALALVNLLVMSNGVFLTPLVGVILDYLWVGELVDGVPKYQLIDFQYALLMLPAACLIAFFMSWFVKETHTQLSDE